jgi:hypothetical protein
MTQKSVSQKKTIAKVVLVMHLVLALSFGILTTIFIAASEIWILLLAPVLGYGLLWAYWLEITKTDSQSRIRWAVSVLFHLVALVAIPMFWLLGLLMSVTVANLGVSLGVIEIALVTGTLFHFILLIASVWAWFLARV